MNARPAWPVWPRAAPATQRLLLEALASGRWTVRGKCTGAPSMEETLARRFAAWNGARHCVPAASGSAALVLALEALDVGAGDEVVVPVLGWVATATAVLAVGAVPVLVDVDPHTACLAVAAVERALTARTRAIIAVHLYASAVDLQPLVELAGAHGVPVIEDCAQAVGARYGDRRVGTWGRLGCFSMNQEKALAAGEGGAVITDDETLCERLHGLRADGMRYVLGRCEPGADALEGFCGVMGANLALSEFQAAVALGQLDTLQAEIERRHANAALLDTALSRLPWLQPLAMPQRLVLRSVYEYGVRVRLEELRCGLGEAAAALTAELGFPVYPTDPPLHRNALFAPHTKRRFARNAPRWAPEGYPAAEDLAARLLVFPHWPLLAETERMDYVVQAFGRLGALCGR